MFTLIAAINQHQKLILSFWCHCPSSKINISHVIAVIGYHVVPFITNDCFPLQLPSSCNCSHQPIWCYLSYIIGFIDSLWYNHSYNCHIIHACSCHHVVWWSPLDMRDELYDDKTIIHVWNNFILHWRTLNCIKLVAIYCHCFQGHHMTIHSSFITWWHLSYMISSLCHCPHHVIVVITNHGAIYHT